MAIKSIDIVNVMAFQAQWRKNNGDCNDFSVQAGDSFCEAFQMQFSDGINVIIGKNGVGKTTLLKMIYAAAQGSIARSADEKTHNLLRFQKMQFDFSSAINIFEPHELASMYSDYISDVDFVIEEEQKIICLEYKNANIQNAANPGALQKKISGEAYPQYPVNAVNAT